MLTTDITFTVFAISIMLTVSTNNMLTVLTIRTMFTVLTQLQYTDTGPTTPSADPISPGAWQGSHWSANF